MDSSVLIIKNMQQRARQRRRQKNNLNEKKESG